MDSRSLKEDLRTVSQVTRGGTSVTKKKKKDERIEEYNSWVPCSLPQPQEYNQGMQGTDVMDQKVMTYYRKTRYHVYTKVAIHLCHIFVSNAHMIYIKGLLNASTYLKNDHRPIRRFITELIESSCANSSTSKTIQTTSLCIPSVVMRKKNRNKAGVLCVVILSRPGVQSVKNQYVW